MSLVKGIARNLVFPTLVGLGFEKLFSATSKNKYQILMYHGVVKKKNSSLSGNHCSLDEFESEIIYLKKNFDIIPLTQLFEQSRSGVVPKRKTISITFDDGYQNNYTNAYKVLKQYNLPATIFVVASCITDPDHLLWYDFVDIIKNEIDFSIFPSLEVELPDGKLNDLQRISHLSKFRLFLKSINTASKYAVLGSIIPKVNAESLISKCDPEFKKMLTISELKEMTDSGLIEIGSHSLTHPNLDTLSDEELIYELSESKKLLEKATGKEITSIAFPDGAYNQNVKSRCLSLGYKNLLSVIPRLANDAEDSSIRPRYCISNTTTPESNILQIHAGFKKWGF